VPGGAGPVRRREDGGRWLGPSGRPPGRAPPGAGRVGPGRGGRAGAHREVARRDPGAAAAVVGRGGADAGLHGGRCPSGPVDVHAAGVPGGRAVAPARGRRGVVRTRAGPHVRAHPGRAGGHVPAGTAPRGDGPGHDHHPERRGEPGAARRRPARPRLDAAGAGADPAGPRPDALARPGGRIRTGRSGVARGADRHRQWLHRCVGPLRARRAARRGHFDTSRSFDPAPRFGARRLS
jgi:hypothetical protein